MKFRVERDVLADAVAWTARALPIRPSAPVLAGLLIEAGPLDDGGEGLQLSTFDYETSARATLNADVADEGRALVSGRLLADICRSLPNKTGRDGDRRSEGDADLRVGPVQPADDAGRGLPDAADRCPRRAGTVPSAPVRQRGRPGGHRRRARRHAAGAHRRPAGDRRRRRSRCSRPTGSGSPAASSPGRPGAADIDAAALVPAKVLADTAKSLTGGTEITIALASLAVPARASSASRAPPAAASVVRRPDCSTASSPRCARCSRSEHLTTARVDRAALVDSVKRVSLVAERNTAVQLTFSDGVLTLDAGTGDEAMASESIEANDHRRGHHHGLQPAVPARRPDRDRVAVRGTGLHTGLQARRTLGDGRPRRGRRHATSATC